MDDPETVLAPLAHYLRPMLLNSWMERRKAAFTENVQQMKRLLDDLQRKLDEVMTAILFCFIGSMKCMVLVDPNVVISVRHCAEFMLPGFTISCLHVLLI